MIIHLSQYDGKYRVVSFACDHNVRDVLLMRNLMVACLEGEHIEILPEGVVINLTQDEYIKLCNSNNYDVYEIDWDGNAYRCYDSCSFDNSVVVTNQCNCNCLMCPTPEGIRNTHAGYSAQALIDIAKHFPTDMPHLTITGGEPFMIRKELFDYLLYLRENYHDTTYQLLTNGRVFCSREYAEEFKRTRPPKMIVGIPIHGCNEETHDEIVQCKGAFKQTVLGIKNLLATKAVIELRIVVSKLNYSFISRIADLIVSEFRGVYCVKIMGLEMTGNAAKNADRVWIDYRTAFLHSKDAVDRLIKAGIDVGLYNFPLCFVDKEYWGICEKSISPNKVRYAPKCDGCHVKDACGGIFSGTIRLTKEEVRPVIKHD